MKIYAHTLFKNEERFLWYSVMSVIDNVDKVLLWDTGSTDGSVRIAKEIKRLFPEKIDFKSLGNVSPRVFKEADVRLEMLKRTDADWILMVDGDEIWWEESIRKVVGFIKRKGERTESIVVPTVNSVGDIFHYQEKAAGRYRLAGRVGHLGLRGINRRLKGLSSSKPHGVWGWTDEKGRMIQDRDPSKIIYLRAPYLHTTFLKRSFKRGSDAKVPKRARKFKYEVGIKVPLDYYFPEVFFKQRPSFVPPVWEGVSSRYFFRALLETPLRKIKRRVLRGKVGY